jgi:hypothetical protein
LQTGELVVLNELDLNELLDSERMGLGFEWTDDFWSLVFVLASRPTEEPTFVGSGCEKSLSHLFRSRFRSQHSLIDYLIP